MQRVVNCILRNNDQVLMLQKPKRDWWVVPGGKIEPTETLQEAISREFFEETNLKLDNSALKGVFNIVIKDENEIIEEWMLFTFYATNFSGKLKAQCEEGNLEWKKISEIFPLPKPKGDNVYLKHILMSNELITGKFIYTPDYELLSYSIDQYLEAVKS